MAGKRIIISESMLKRLVSESIISESNVDDVIKSKDFEKKVKELTNNAIKNDKNIEKEIKKIVGKAVENLFKTLWQRNNFWRDL